jgi:FtsP/CotA-like multicopper oxidase with cupredoxin domain
VTYDRSRRDFLRLGWKLGAGLALPAGLLSCGGGSGDSSSSLPDETFVEPRRFQSIGGELDVTLRVAYFSTTLKGKAVMLRAMNDSIPAPTLSVNAGDTLRIRVVNQLPANRPSNEPTKHLRYPNSTNLHTHGLHVTPGLVAPGVYGDYVMDDPSLGVQPGQTRQHEYRIGLDHPPGAYWYHPHLHGSAALQVGSGMAGALLVKGDIDLIPEIAAAVERVFVFQSPIINGSGTLESFTQVSDDPFNETPLLINGVRRPRIIMRRQEVQNWHFINAAIFNFVNLSMDEHALHVYSQDGNTRRSMLSIGPDPGRGVVLAPGNRASVLVQAGAPGTYYLRTLRLDIGTIMYDDILAEIVVVDRPAQMTLPSGPLPIPAKLASITDEELASAGGLKRTIVMRTVSNDFQEPITVPPASLVVHPGSELDDWIFETGPTGLADKVFALGSASGQASLAPGLPSEYIPFQSSRALKQTVALGSVEEWTILNMNIVGHAFHIHINPFQVVSVNGMPVDPYWADTIGLSPNGSPTNPTSVTFRTRFRDFAGATVMHCHLIAHEDMGMMQTVEIV